MNKRFPRYPDDADYQTNAPSYYEDLARKQELIKKLSKKVWEYDQTLNMKLEEIEELVKKVLLKLEDEFNEEIYDLLVLWVEDGTLDFIINETLMNKKADKTDLEMTNEIISKLESELKEKIDENTTFLYDEIKTNKKSNEENILNVKDYGVIGDGIAIDGYKIQEVLNLAHDLGGGTVFIPSGKYLIEEPLYFKENVNIKGQNVSSTSIIKMSNKKLTNNLTYQDNHLGNINYNDYDAILIGVGRVGDFIISDLRLEGMSGNDNDFKNDYGILIQNSYRVNLKRLFIRYAEKGLEMKITWNTVLETVRIQHAGTGFEIGSWDGITSTSVNFINTFVDYCLIGYKITNLTYFSGNGMSCDFSEQIGYYFDTSYGGINGLGIEYAENQWIKSHRSVVNIAGMYNLSINSFNKNSISESNALIEVTSVSRIGTGLVITGSELRSTKQISNPSFYIQDGSFVNINGSNLYSFLNNTGEIIKGDSSSFIRTDDTLRYESRQILFNNIDYTNSRIMPQRDGVVYGLDNYEWYDYDTSRNKSEININVTDIRKALPNFMDLGGKAFSIPYKLTFNIGNTGETKMYTNIIIVYDRVYTDNMITIPENNDLNITLNSTLLTLNFPSTTNPVYLSIKPI